MQDEASLVATIYTHYKNTPNTHKLGVLYVVDSVTRQWIERARQAGQALDQPKSATDGTYAAGVRRMNGLLPIFMNDLFLGLPENQKVCLDIATKHISRTCCLYTWSAPAHIDLL